MQSGCLECGHRVGTIPVSEMLSEAGYWQARGFDCATGSDDSHEMFVMNKLGLMNDSRRPTITFIPINQIRRTYTMTSSRYVGLDIHKRHVMVAAVNAHQDLVLTPQKVAIDYFPSWAKTHLQASDHVALEATSNSWVLHDQLKPLVKTVAVANTFQLKLISASAAKTDKQDALVLAKLLAANLLPAVWLSFTPQSGEKVCPRKIGVQTAQG
jgi:hypothetical protein